MARELDLTGQVFGRLTAVRKIGKDKRRNCLWECVCECGGTTHSSTMGLRRGDKRSCGCMLKEHLKNLIEINSKHSHSKINKVTPEYRAWINMKSRCYDINNTGYSNYGQRGISVCDEWVNDFERFLSDMGPRPSNKHSIDRIDVNGNYEPSNCRWATTTQQLRNRRCEKDNKTGVKGVHPYKNNRFIARIKVGGKEIHLGTFNTIEEAVVARKQAEKLYWEE